MRPRFANDCWPQELPAFRNCLGNQTLAWNNEQPNAMWIGHRDQPNETLIENPAMMHSPAAKIANYPGGHCEGFPGTFKQLRCRFKSHRDRGRWVEVKKKS